MFKKIALSALLFSSLASTAYADISLSKIRIAIEPHKTAENLVLKNDGGKEAKAFQFTLKKWTQKADSAPEYLERGGLKDYFEDADEIVVSPETFVLPPDKDKTVRMIVNEKDTAQKTYSYRLFINELPMKEGQDKENSTKITFLYEFILPLFVQHDKTKVVADMKLNTTTEVIKDQSFLNIVNSDDEHIQVKQVDIGEQNLKFNQYVLPGSHAHILLKDVKLKSGQKMKVDTDHGVFEYQVK